MLGGILQQVCCDGVAEMVLEGGDGRGVRDETTEWVSANVLSNSSPSATVLLSRTIIFLFALAAPVPYWEEVLSGASSVVCLPPV